MKTLSGFLAPRESSHVIPNEFSESTVDFGLRDALQLVQQMSGICDTGFECQQDKDTILIVLSVLIICIGLVCLAFFFFREDKEEQVTPLCPQLLVRDSSFTFKIGLDSKAEKLDVLDDKDASHVIAQVAMDWPDPFRTCASGIASTARLQNSSGMNLATVVARNVAVSGQAIALCRSGCEIFGFVEPDTPTRYHVRHRTGAHLLTLIGDFSTWDVQGVNAAGATVFSAKQEDGFCVGQVQQHVDLGLCLSCVIAVHIHRFMQQPAQGMPVSSPPPNVSTTSGELVDHPSVGGQASVVPEIQRPVASGG